MARASARDEWNGSVYQGSHALKARPGRVRMPRAAVWIAAALVLAAASALAAALLTVAPAGRSVASARVRTRQPSSVTSVLAGSPAGISAATARLLLSVAPSVVVANAARPSDVAAAASIAGRAHAPLLLMSPGGDAAAQASVLRSAITALGPRAVLPVGIATAVLAADLPNVKVVTSARALPETRAAAPLRRVTVLVHDRRSAAGSAVAIAAATTARAAGAQLVKLPGYNPGTDPAAIRALAASKPMRVVAIGARFGPKRLLAERVAVAETGVQLPGGGQVLFPMRRIVALYGHPATPALGALGQQSLTASIARARAVATQYSALSKVPVIPAFEIIATVAQASPGRSGSYSSQSSVASLRPWATAATKAGMYVTLDLQPGRANLLTQAKLYRSLLRLPNVGLALDPEWHLGPRQRPLRQIGSVGISEVNDVAAWLARLTAKYRLPQKLLELHEFRLSMIRDIQRLDTRHADLAIVVNMDGQGAPSTKQQTWAAVVANAPGGVFFGWKDFYVKDNPMLDPRSTIGHTPAPVLISYQ